MPELTALLKRTLDGETEAFGEVVVRFQSAVVGWALSRLGNLPDAEDAAQEAFVTAYRKLGDLKDLESFPAWLRRITASACSSRLRRAKLATTGIHEAEVQSSAACSTAHPAEKNELRDAILAALRSLPPANRTSATLYYMGGYSVREVASMLGVPQGTVKRRLHDSRRYMRQAMTEYAPVTRRRAMTKKLEGLRWEYSWTSHLGCVNGCLKYLGSDITRAWLFGGTGHAFIINMHDEICPSGPTAWHTEMLFKLAPNLGYYVGGDCTDKSKPDFAAKQEALWTYARRCLDDGVPCYGWELKVPEYYLICGYDDEGYYFTGPACDDGDGPKPWRELGVSDIGVLELYSVQLRDPAPDDEVVKAALSFALKHADDPKGWVNPGYSTGAAAYEAWAAALDASPVGFGHRYNVAVWSQNRTEAVGFLREAKDRLAGKADGAFDEAIGHYSVVADKLKSAHDLHPFFHDDKEDEPAPSADAAELVRAAGAAESEGLIALRKIVGAL